MVALAGGAGGRGDADGDGVRLGDAAELLGQLLQHLPRLVEAEQVALEDVQLLQPAGAEVGPRLAVIGEGLPRLDDRGRLQQRQPVLGDADLRAALQDDLLHRAVFDVDVVEAVEVLEDPRPLGAALDLGVAARHVGVRQVDVAGRLAADEQAAAFQLDAAAAPLGVSDFEILHKTTPWLPVQGVQPGERRAALHTS